MMSLYSFFSAIELGLIYSLMVLGLFISYRILNIPDLTVDGSFTLGAAVAVVATLAGHPVLGLLLAALAGAAAGFVTALLQTRMKIPSPLLHWQCISGEHAKRQCSCILPLQQERKSS